MTLGAGSMSCRGGRVLLLVALAAIGVQRARVGLVAIVAGRVPRRGELVNGCVTSGAIGFQCCGAMRQPAMAAFALLMAGERFCVRDFGLVARAAERMFLQFE
jgi:hypothetical protein